ncbi:UxaA family hydrolase [Halobacteria archaeon AArc-m2/3/4]|uniref:UxaA family hydrolase n=1 Tax=Natronoglomus mannanivorans TaxID=2979990 RepID=A0ABT2QEP8_9EURY|nr:UxaA family hydrolase [Halobacteria archaeon AArc-m2/3/4]
MSESQSERRSRSRGESENAREGETEAHTARETAADEGNRRGIRDNVLILPSVVCSHTVAEQIADAVEGCVATPHDNGCGQIGRDNDLTERTLIAMGAHPNVAGTVVVGLGCEHVQSDTVADALEDRGVPVRELSIQGVGGTEACIERGIEAAEELRAGESVETSDINLTDLTIGIVSTDLEDPTVETADPLVGEFADRVLAAGGRVVAAGTERVSAHPEDARERIDADLDELLAAARSGPARAPRVRRQVGERSFEAATRAWGDAPVDELLEYGESPRADTGLALVDSSSRFEEAATALVAAGAHLIVHVTGDGIPTGHPIAPVVKVSATERTLEAVGADIDVDARTASVDDLAEYVQSVANGTPCRAEVHGVTSFAIERAGPSM